MITAPEKDAKVELAIQSQADASVTTLEGNQDTATHSLAKVFSTTKGSTEPSVDVLI